MSKRKLILAGTHEQAHNYAREHQFSPRDYRVLSNPEQIMGTKPDAWEIVKVGTWYTNHKMCDFLRAHPDWHTVIR